MAVQKREEGKGTERRESASVMWASVSQGRAIAGERRTR